MGAIMRILVACEESQAVTKAFRSKGHEAYSADIQDCSGGHPEWHIKADVLPLLGEKWDMVIAFPPCTYLSNAGARWLYRGGKLQEERYKKGLEGKAFFMRFLNSNIPRICVENPEPSTIFDMPSPTQIIEPYEFGHPYSKKTFLWLRGLPPLRPTKYIWDHTPFVKSSSHRGKYQPPTKNAKERSKTFTGVAAAMAEQWTNPIWMQYPLFEEL